jgi:hypothetical protein
MKKPKVHPVAELFPMMSDEELDDLAEDIKANGLLHPIVLDESGMLIDGRNRFEACRRAGLEPECETLNGQDPVAFIMSSNDKRRHMKLGQRAMVAARICLIKNISQPKAAKVAGVSQGYVGHAAIVLQYCPDLAESVSRGDIALNEAYEKALTLKREAESDEGKMRRLRKQAPDLADQVTDEKLTLAEAIGALEARQYEEVQRKENLNQQRKLSTGFLCDTINHFYSFTLSPEEKADRFLELFNEKYATEEITSERLQNCADVLKILTRKWDKIYGRSKEQNSQTNA